MAFTTPYMNILVQHCKEGFKKQISPGSKHGIPFPLVQFIEDILGLGCHLRPHRFILLLVLIALELKILVLGWVWSLPRLSGMPWFCTVYRIQYCELMHSDIIMYITSVSLLTRRNCSTNMYPTHATDVNLSAFYAWPPLQYMYRICTGWFWWSRSGLCWLSSVSG